MTDEKRSRALSREEFESVMKRATELAASDPDSLDESSRTVMSQELLQFVRTNARVYVDVARANGAEGNRVRVETDSLDLLNRIFFEVGVKTTPK